MSDTKAPLFLLAMPPSEEFRRLSRHISSSLEEIGIKTIFLGDTLVPGVSIFPSIQRAIELADAVIVDVTETNPNVMYEAGFASALGKPLLPMVQRSVKRVPSDMGNRFYVVYDPSKLDKLRDDIKDWALDYLRSDRAKNRAVWG